MGAHPSGGAPTITATDPPGSVFSGSASVFFSSFGKTPGKSTSGNLSAVLPDESGRLALDGDQVPRGRVGRLQVGPRPVMSVQALISAFYCEQSFCNILIALVTLCLTYSYFAYMFVDFLSNAETAKYCRRGDPPSRAEQEKIFFLDAPRKAMTGRRVPEPGKVRTWRPSILQPVASIHTGEVTSSDVVQMSRRDSHPTARREAIDIYRRIVESLHAPAPAGDEDRRRGGKGIRNLQKGRHVLTDGGLDESLSDPVGR
ncbi:hypothetical protein [Glutamicibacter protophormiae]|uniref:hypothetical protein n=1 Tax=Glutamicibacter protophormiae TaxID=37930 RepID=UPI003332A98B